MFSLDYHPFAQRYGSAATVPFVEALLRARGDLDKSDVKDIVRLSSLTSSLACGLTRYPRRWKGSKDDRRMRSRNTLRYSVDYVSQSSWILRERA